MERNNYYKIKQSYIMLEILVFRFELLAHD